MNIESFVYIVDDDYAVRDSLSLVFEAAGIASETFESAEQFLERYCPGKPGCLLLDVNMPGMVGTELQAELKRRNIQIPIIFLTAYGDIPMTVQTIKAGAVDFLTKPVLPGFCWSTFRRCCNMKYTCMLKPLRNMLYVTG